MPAAPRSAPDAAGPPPYAPGVTDWATIASFATAAGTLVLAAATFSSVRSANRSARIAERSFQIGLRPILAPSRLEDPPQRVMFVDRHWVELEGGRAAVEVVDDAIYLAMAVRNVGSGMAMIEAWQPFGGQRTGVDGWTAPDAFRLQTRALLVAPGDVGFWQGALRQPELDPYPSIRQAVSEGTVSIDLLYRDHEGGQRTITRFSLVRRDRADGRDPSGDGQWWISLANHHTLDHE
jgi:hypothetical protein